MLILTYQDAIKLLCFRKVVTMTNDIIKKENITLNAVEPELGNAIINWGEGQISLTKVLRKLGKKESDLLPPKNVNSTCTKDFWEELKMLCARSYGADMLALYMQPKQNNPERTAFAPKISSRIGNIRDLIAGKKGKKKAEPRTPDAMFMAHLKDAEKKLTDNSELFENYDAIVEAMENLFNVIGD